MEDGKGGQKCLYAKFDGVLTISYQSTSKGKTYAKEPVPSDSSQVQLNGSHCFNNTNTSSLDVTWKSGNFHLSLDFFQGGGHWFMETVTIEYNSAALVNSSETGTVRMQKTNQQSPGFFQQQFPSDYYYFCNSNIDFAVNDTVKVSLAMRNARIFPYTAPQKATKWLCYKDAQEEGKIVPIVVGAVIAFLMLTIFVVYVIFYAKRKVSERRARRSYVTLSNDSDQ